MAATDLLRRIGKFFGGLLGSFLAMGGAKAIDLPADKAEAMFHSYSGGGVTALGPAFLVRKSVADRVSLSGSYYLDAVSNASICASVMTSGGARRTTSGAAALTRKPASRAAVSTALACGAVRTTPSSSPRPRT